MADRLPSLNALRAFEAAARHASFRQAAAELHVTTAAISQQIKALEADLGTPLMRRSNGAWQLTAAGNAGLAELRQGFDRLHEAARRMRLAGRQQRRLTVSVVPSFAATWLVPLAQHVATTTASNPDGVSIFHNRINYSGATGWSVAVLDADQEGFLRSDRSLIQTVGRAARHLSGRAILYADRVTGSMERALNEMNRRRETQLAYNVEHGITPRSIVKSVGDIRFVTRVADARAPKPGTVALRRPADASERETLIRMLEQQMQAAAEELDFELAAVLRDQLLELKADAPLRERAQPVR